MSTEIAQKGQKVLVGFNGVTYTGFIMDSSGEKPVGDLGYIPDDNDNDATQIFSDDGTEFTIAGVIKNVSTEELANLRLIEIGSDLTVNSIACIVTDANLSFQRLDATGTISCSYLPAINEAEA
jgi:hypothetical protein